MSKTGKLINVSLKRCELKSTIFLREFIEFPGELIFNTYKIKVEKSNCSPRLQSVVIVEDT